MTATLEELLSVAMLVPLVSVDEHPTTVRCQWGIPLMLWGMPGIGKSEKLRSAAASLNLPYRVVELGTRQPEDASGVPFLNKEDQVIIECIIGAVNELNKAGGGILCLDEVSNARPAVQGAFMSLPLERRVGDTKLHRNIRVVLAGNPIDCAAGGYAMAAPFANRFGHINVKAASNDEFISYITGRSKTVLMPLDEGESRVSVGWSYAWARAVGSFVGFLKVKPGAYDKMPPHGHPDLSRAWASPRTAHLAVLAYATVLALGKSEDLANTLIEAIAGGAFSTEWATWRQEADLPTPVKVLAGEWEVDTERLDRSMAVLTSVERYVAGLRGVDQEDAAVRTWRLLEKVVGKGLSDLAVTTATALVDMGLAHSGGADVSAAAKPVLLQFGKSGIAAMASSK